MQLPKILLLTLWTAVFVVNGGQMPDFSQDFYYEDIADSLDERQEALDLRWENEDKPDHCRIDWCPTEVEFTEDHGTFNWIQSVVGYRLHIRCPYSVYNPVYAVRDCVVENTTVRWLDPDTEACPGPPIKVLLEQLEETRPGTTGESFAWDDSAMTSVADSLVTWSNQPMDIDDVTRIALIAANVIDRPYALPNRTAVNLLQMADALFARSLWDYSLELNNYQYPNLKERFVLALSRASDALEVPSGENRFEVKGQVVTSIVVKQDGRESAHVTLTNFPVDEDYVNSSATVPEAEVTVLLDNSDAQLVHVLYIGSTSLLKSSRMDVIQTLRLDLAPEFEAAPTLEAPFPEFPQTVWPPDVEGGAIPVPAAQSVPVGTDSPPALGLPDPPDPWMDAPDPTLDDSFEMGHQRIEPATSPEPGYGADPLTAGIGSENSSVTAGFQDTSIAGGFDTMEALEEPQLHQEMSWYQRQMSGPLLYVATSPHTAPSSDRLENYRGPVYPTVVTVEYALGYKSGPDWILDDAEPLCAHLPLAYPPWTDGEDFDLSEWHSDSQVCRLVNATYGDQTLCQCRGTGFFSVFGAYNLFLYSDYDAYPEFQPEASLAEFFGFEFRKELYVASHVLRAISLLCLLLFLASYAKYKEARRGVARLLLLNLCCALLILLIVLYVAEGVAGDRLGCRVSNILRYYLILVSLLWNAAEAVNMYLMLVRVFNSEINRYVLKAGILAWGLPAVGVAIVLGVSLKGFDGVYDDSCALRCRLRPGTMYFAYLLPLGLIMLLNISVFILVIRVLLTRSKPTSAQHQDKGLRSHWVRLSGALSLLFLLGVPWIFSAFGALNTENNSDTANLELVFQIVFVVGVNLQGIFIFWFHLVRKLDLQWKSSANRLHSSSANTRTSAVSYRSSKDEPASRKSKPMTISSGNDSMSVGAYRPTENCV